MGNCCVQSDKYKIKEETHGNQIFRTQYYFKILLVGDQNVGKSSLLNRITTNEVLDSITPTIGVDFARKSLLINDSIVKFHFWDPSGNPRFRELLPNYFSGINAVLMVYDITNEQSFISCRDNWLPNIKCNACPPPTLSVILANKLDLDSDRAIRVAQGLELANEKNSLFMEVSAKSGDNVENLLYTIGTQLIHMHQQRSQH